MRATTSNSTAHQYRNAQSVHLLDGASWELNIDMASQILLDSADYMVLGIMGTGGTGKSSLANILCNRSTPTQAVHGVGVKLGGSQFPTRSPLSTRHATSGIEIRAHMTGSGERLLCLDSQPLLSSSILSDLAAHPSPMDLAGSAASSSALTASLLSALSRQHTGAAGSTASERAHAAALAPQLVAALHDLQLATMLLTCCHTVVVTLEHAEDTRVLQLLQAAEVVARSLPDITLPPGISHSSHVILPLPHGQGHSAAAATSTTQGYVAQVVFVVTGQDPDLSGRELAAALKQQQRALRLLMCESGISMRPGLCLDIVAEVSARAGRGDTVNSRTVLPPAVEASKPATQQNPMPAQNPVAAAGEEEEEMEAVSGSKGGDGRKPTTISGEADKEQLVPLALCAGLPLQHFYALPDLSGSSCQQQQQEKDSGGWCGLAADHGWRSCATQLRERLLSLPRSPFARMLSEREMMRAYERAWSAVLSSPVLHTHAMGMMGLHV